MSRKAPGDTALVFSSERGQMCPTCHQPIANCRCREPQSVAAKGGVVRVARETKGRKGKGVTLISGVPLAGEALAKLATELKQRCACGGTVRDGVIEIQGDHRDLIVEELSKHGWTVKRAGG